MIQLIHTNTYNIGGSTHGHGYRLLWLLMGAVPGLPYEGIFKDLDLRAPPNEPKPCAVPGLDSIPEDPPA